MSDKKVICVFPGQGAQQVGMGKDFLNESWAKDMWAEANSILGYDLLSIVLEGPETELKSTKITQVAVFMIEMITLEAIRRNNIIPFAVAGHSLGEYAAVVASGALDWKTGLKLVEYRGKIFSETAAANPGSMAAVIGLSEEVIASVLSKIDGIAEIVNYNSPGQLVISFQSDIKEQICSSLKDAGAKMVVPLEVSGGFHSSLMNSALKPMQERLDNITFADPTIKFYSNVTAEIVNSSAAMKEALVKQINSPVQWIKIVENIISESGTEFVFLELGPGKVLRGLIKRIDKTVKTLGISSPEDLIALS